MLAGAAGVLAACQDPVRPAVPTQAAHGHLRRSVQFAPTCAGIPSFPAQPVSSPYGVGVNTLAPIAYGDPTTGATYGTIATLLREANIGWVRQDFDWGRIIANKAYQRDTSQIDWGPMDAAVNNAYCHGLNILGNLAYTPVWAAARLTTVPDSLKYRYLPDDLNDWAAFVRAAVNHYPQIRYWSIWNEPNGDPRDNSMPFFRGYGTETSTDQLVPAYEALIQYAAPHIRENYDAQGRRYLVGPELAGGGPATDTWLNRVLADQGPNIDAVAVHKYGDASGITDYVGGLTSRAGGGLPGWPWPVWLTEAGPTGCNQINVRRPVDWYCRGYDYSYIDDQYQADHLARVLQGMQGRWAKTFYWHSHAEVVNDNDGSNNYGILGGARENSLFARPAFTAYAGIAGPLGLTGSGTYGYDQNVTVAATPAVPSSYYYVWEYQWCYNGNAPGDCDHQWHWYNEGQDVTSIAPYVYRQDYYVYTRVTQYAWQNGPQVGGGEWDISGAGECSVPGGCGGSGGGMLSTPSSTTVGRRKGHKGGKNK